MLPISAMLNPFEHESRPLKIAFEPSDLAWTPRGMSAVQAIAELPLVCHRLLSVPPCEYTLRRLEHCHQINVMVNCHATAALVARCIATGRQMMERADYEEESEAAKRPRCV